MSNFEDPFADLSHLDNPYEQLARAIWRLGAGEHNAVLGDTIRMTAVCLVAEYETVDGGVAIRMNVRNDAGMLPHWRAKGLVQALSEFVNGEITAAQGGNRAGPTRTDDDEV